MILALATLLFQIPAVPQAALPAVAAVVSAPSVVSPQLTPSPSEPSPAPAPDSSQSPDLDSIPSVAYLPGRTTLEALSPSASDLAPASLGAPSQPDNLAFIAAVAPAAARAREERRRRNIWLGLSLAQHGAAAFDAWSTRRAISSGRARELNPFMRPFAGNSSIYAAIQVGPLVTDYLSHRMMHSRYAWMRHTWWIPQVLGTASSLASGINNLQFHN